MVLNNLLVEYFCLVDLHHQRLDSLFISQVPLALLFFELSLLVTKLHNYALLFCALPLDLTVELVIFILDLAHLLIRQVDSAKDVRR